MARPGAAPDSAFDAVLAEGQVLERRGARDEARRTYEAALHDGRATDAVQVGQLLRLISRAHMLDGDYAAADDCAIAAAAVAEQNEDELARARAINMLATIHWTRGQHDEAQHLYLEARDTAQRIGDARLAAMTASNLGIIATVRGNDREASGYYEAGLQAARGAGLVDETLIALVNLGQLHLQMSRFPDAERSFTEGREIATVIGDMGMLMRLELYFARLHLKQGALDSARAAHRESLELAEQTGETFLNGDLEHVAGMIARLDGDAVHAEAHFRLAEHIAMERKDLILQGETARELAELYRTRGRNRDTLQRLNQAHRIFLQLRARRELADVDRRTSMLESDFLDVVRKWGESIEEKDIYTQGHCVRVADMACAIWSRVTEGDDTSLFWFRIGALLHDVGKLMIPAEVLNKPGALTEDEWLLMRRHPSAGVELLADIDFPWDVRPIVESHHERWDGRGYPHGLAGEAIPLTARVLCIADVYDALTTRRSYKKALRHDEAIAIMRADVGTQFDPAIFAVFDDIVRRGAWRQAGDAVAAHA